MRYLSILLAALAMPLQAEELSINWQNPTENVDGSSIVLGEPSQLTAARIIVREGGVQVNAVDITFPAQSYLTNAMLTLACGKSYAITMTVTNSQNETSGESNVLTHTTVDCDPEEPGPGPDPVYVPLPPIIVSIDGVVQAVLELAPTYFDGSIFEYIPHEETNLALAAGTIEVDFNIGFPAEQNVGLLSRDESGFQTGGHLTIYVTELGAVCVRHQNTEQGNTLCSPDASYTFDTEASLVYTFGPTGAKLEFEGVEYAEPAWSEGIQNNTRPLVIGAQAWSCSGDLTVDSSCVKGLVVGTIAVRIYGE